MNVANEIDDYFLGELKKISVDNGFLTNPKVTNVCSREVVDNTDALLQVIPHKEYVEAVNGQSMKIVRIYKILGSSKNYGQTDLSQFNALMTDTKRAVFGILSASGNQPFTAVKISEIDMEPEYAQAALFSGEIRVTYVQKFGV